MVTGEPGSGKTTLGTELARVLRTPFLSRDQVRGGQLATDGIWTNTMANPSPRERAVDALTAMVEATARAGVSAVVEFVVFGSRREAFARFEDVANVLVVRAECADARERARRRDLADPLLNRPEVLAALGYDSVAAYLDGATSEGDRVRDEMVHEFDLPLLSVRTDDGYEPSLDAIADWVVDQTR